MTKQNFYFLLKKENKKGQAIHITPLRPVTLAAFPPWGSSPGAGCMRLAQPQKYKCFLGGKIIFTLCL